MKQESEGAAVTDADRRLLLKTAAAGIGAALMAAPLRAQPQAASVQARGEAFAQSHQPKPLPFSSSSLNGLSQRLIDSHWANNYGGAVRALNETKYVDAFFNNINWEQVVARMEALRLSAA